MTRTITTSLIRALQRQKVEATPFARASDDISLVNVVQNSAHLAPLVTNAHAACNVTTFAGGAGTFAGFELMAPATRTLKIYFLENTLGGTLNARCALAPNGTFTPGAASPCMEWGDEPVAGLINSGLRNAGLTGETVFFGDGTAGFTPIFVSPGEVFACQHAGANLIFTAAIGWEEFG